MRPKWHSGTQTCDSEDRKIEASNLDIHEIRRAEAGIQDAVQGLMTDCREFLDESETWLSKGSFATVNVEA